jgi:Hint domain
MAIRNRLTQTLGIEHPVLLAPMDIVSGCQIDDVLIPVEFLVNHRSIIWDDRAREIEIYHVEVRRHGVLLANGAPAESYRDDGNRWLFHNANAQWNRAPATALAAQPRTRADRRPGDLFHGGRSNRADGCTEWLRLTVFSGQRCRILLGSRG